MLEKLANNPARIASAMIALTGAIIALFVAFDVPITATQQAAITGLVAVIANDVVRALVMPTRKVAELLQTPAEPERVARLPEPPRLPTNTDPPPGEAA